MSREVHLEQELQVVERLQPRQEPQEKTPVVVSAVPLP